LLVYRYVFVVEDSIGLRLIQQLRIAGSNQRTP
jgi:hypothetical protein